MNLVRGVYFIRGHWVEWLNPENRCFNRINNGLGYLIRVQGKNYINLRLTWQLFSIETSRALLSIFQARFTSGFWLWLVEPIAEQSQPFSVRSFASCSIFSIVSSECCWTPVLWVYSILIDLSSFLQNTFFQLLDLIWIFACFLLDCAIYCSCQIKLTNFFTRRWKNDRIWQ